jgi:hypothetical protein
MKKKILSFVLVFCLIVPCVFALTACGKNPPADEPTTLTKADYSNAFSSVTTSYNAYINAPQATGLSLSSGSISDDDLITLDRQNQMVRMSTACVQLVGFLKNLCNNQTFEISKELQEMSIIDTSVPGYTGNYKLRISMDFDKTTSVITSNLYCEADGDYKTYLTVEVLFDFKTEALDYFTIGGVMGSGQLSNSNVNYFKFKNNTLKMLPQSSTLFETYAQAVLNKCDEIAGGEWGSNLPDYSQEYISAMLGNA